MFYTYILYSTHLNRYYIGYTSNIEERLSKHNNKSKGSFTNNASDWKVVFQREFTFKAEAFLFERTIKNWKSRKMVEKLFFKRPDTKKAPVLGAL